MVDLVDLRLELWMSGSGAVRDVGIVVSESVDLGGLRSARQYGQAMAYGVVACEPESLSMFGPALLSFTTATASRSSVTHETPRVGEGARL